MKHDSEPEDSFVAADRRKSLRAPLIVLRVRIEDDRTTFFGYAKNISRSGLFIGATSPKEIGDRFSLQIPLPDPINQTVRCECEVVWRRPWSKQSTPEPGMGIRFVDLRESDAETIDRWIESTWREEERRR